MKINTPNTLNYPINYPIMNLRKGWKQNTLDQIISKEVFY